MRNYAGKGLFFIFLGLIAFGISDGLLQYILTGIVIVYGIVLIVIYFVAQRDVQYELIK